MSLTPEEMFYLATGLVNADCWTNEQETDHNNQMAIHRTTHQSGRRRNTSPLSSRSQRRWKSCSSTSSSCQSSRKSSSHPSSLSSSSSSWSSLWATRNCLLVVTLLLLAFCSSSADACSSRSTPKPRPPPPPPNPSPALRPNITFQTYACPPAYAAWYCLNGATCFTVKIGESILYNCECTEGYMGQRCEFKDLDGSYLPLREKIMLERASIAGGATVAVVLVVILSIIFYTYMRQRRKEKPFGANVVEVTVDRLEKRAASARMAAAASATPAKTGNALLHIKLIHYAASIDALVSPSIDAKKASILPALLTPPSPVHHHSGVSLTN